MIFIDVRSDDDKYLITLVYRFVFANEAICGDPFSESEWLPAGGKCFVNCDPTVHLCMVHTNSDIQKCRLYSKACQAAIRKHLGWTTTIVSVFRPPITTTPSPHAEFRVGNIDRAFRDEEHRNSMNVDRSAVEAAENIERDLMGSQVTTPSLSSSNELVANEESMVVEVITSSPNDEFNWLEAPRIEMNGYSFHDTSRFISEPSRQQSTEPDESASEYEGLAENVIRPTMVNTESSHDSSSTIRHYQYALPQPPAPKPSPPAFPPFHLPKPSVNSIVPPPDKELVPKYINFLEVPDDQMNGVDEEPLRPVIPQPPGFRPIENNEFPSEVASNLFPSADRPSEPIMPSIPPSWNIPPKRPYQNMRIVPSDTEVALPEGSALREAYGSKYTGGTRFEVIPPPAPLAPAIALGTVGKGMPPIPDLSRRVHHFTDPSSKMKVFAEMQPDIEGIKSCTRLVDVDVEDCFQSSKLSRYFGLKNAETEEEKRSIIESIVQQKLKRIRHQRRVIAKQRH
ncbi:hypothetical protein OSTOST_00701 [Ostertagia ostertagi]